MIFSAKVKCLIFVSLFGLAASSSGDAESRGTIENRVTDALHNLFSKVDPIYLPFFPTVGYNPYDGVDFSLSLTDITMTGLASVIATNVTIPGVRGGYVQVDLWFPQLLLHAGEYSAGGHIANMPFTGESFLSVSFEDMTLSLGMEFSTFDFIPPSLNFCANKGSTSWQMNIFKPIINFDNINPGTDQGELVNTIFGAFVPDIVDYIVILLNDPGSNLHNMVDNLLVSNINARFCL